MAICGTGHGGHTLAVAASASAEEVVWLSSSHERAAVIRERALSAGGLRAKGAVAGTAHRLTKVSSDPRDVVPQADMVVLVQPAYDHLATLRRIAPHLAPTAWIVAMPARSGLEFDLFPLRDVLATESRPILGLQTLPWLCRIQETGGEVDVLGVKARVVGAGRPGAELEAATTKLTRLLGIETILRPSFANLTLGNPGQIIHPGVMYGIFRRWTNEVYRGDRIPSFYSTMDESTGRRLERLSKEAVEVATHLFEESGRSVDLAGVVGIREWLESAYPGVVDGARSLAEAFRLNPAYRNVKAPMRPASTEGFVPDFQHRFLADDAPNGLAVTKAVATLLDVPTPEIDAILTWAQERLGRGDPGVSELRTPQRCGLTTSAALCEFYRRW